MRRSILQAALVVIGLVLVSGCQADGTKEGEPTAVEPEVGPETGTDTSTSDESKPDARGGSGSEGPRAPSLALFDADGNRVAAVIKQARLYSKQFTELESGDEVRAEGARAWTVEVLAIGEHRVPETYLQLNSGQIRPGTIYFKDQQCSEGYFPGELTAGRVDQTVYWPSGQVEDVGENDTFWEISPETGECEKYSDEHVHFDHIIPAKPAPEWFQNAFSNPPYEVRPVY